ncbi:hypothetical protein BgiMline_013356, partial [Biomphalaria glabrata]
ASVFITSLKVYPSQRFSDLITSLKVYPSQRFSDCILWIVIQDGEGERETSCTACRYLLLTELKGTDADTRLSA